MKIILSALSCLVAFSSWAQTDRISAIGYVVEDIDRSETFYTEVLGMRPAGSFSLDATWSREAGAAGGRPFSVKMFRLGDGPDATLLKLAYFESTTPRPLQEGLDTPAGVNYLTLNYGDLQPVVDRLREAGTPVVGYVRRENYQLLFIRDPDGLYIELVGSPDPPVLLD
jgi:catechol 2,3-dioxygenase-like lactoylglutathione lyase family enzyme